MNDVNDKEHDKARKRLGMSWEEYWLHIAQQRVGSEEEQVADVLAQLRAGGSENKIRADTIERLLARRIISFDLVIIKPKSKKKKKKK